MEIIRGIREAADSVIEALKKKSQKVGIHDQNRIAQIATIAANNDQEIGSTLFKAFKDVGKDGVITIEEGKGTETDVKVVSGMQFDRGYLSPHFVTDQKTLEAELENAYVLIHEDKISNVKKLIPLLEATSRANKPLLIIAEDVESEALATLVVNKLRGIVNCVAVKAPGYGDRRKAMLEDIAILTGAEAVFKDLGVDLEKVTLKQLGRAKKVTVTADTTTIVDGAGKAADVERAHQADPARDRVDRQQLRQGEAPGAAREARRRRRADQRRRRDRDRDEGEEGAHRGRAQRGAGRARGGHRPGRRRRARAPRRVGPEEERRLRPRPGLRDPPAGAQRAVPPDRRERRRPSARWCSSACSTRRPSRSATTPRPANTSTSSKPASSIRRR